MIRKTTTLLAITFAFLSWVSDARAQDAAPPPSAGGIQISWEVRNRFRLFREERDFQLQVEAMASGRTVLAAEDALEIQSDGRGWARNTVGRLCIDPAGHDSTQITVRDILIAGLGDSIASGEGNPDRPVALADDGFCFRSYLEGSTGQYYRPSRKGYKGARACESAAGSNELFAWQKFGAQWFNAACHRSLYSYQTRAALALAIQYTHIAVTYLPLACSGATVGEGLL